VWKKGEELEYTVKSAHLCVRKDEVREDGTVFKMFWKSKVVSTALVTARRMLENKLATKANLERRGIIVASSTCSLCGIEEETSTHLFFECKSYLVIVELLLCMVGRVERVSQRPIVKFFPV